MGQVRDGPAHGILNRAGAEGYQWIAGRTTPAAVDIRALTTADRTPAPHACPRRRGSAKGRRIPKKADLNRKMGTSRERPFPTRKESQHLNGFSRTRSVILVGSAG